MQRLLVITMNDSKKSLTWYEIKIEQLSSVHIGKKNYGVLAETRLFIPGWTIWGALVNSYGRLNGGSIDAFKEGKGLFENITCFYIIKDKREIMFPKFNNGKLYLGNMSEEEFRNKFTYTFTSTAIEPDCVAARDASLHEIETILSKAKDGKKNICWVGLVGIEDSKKEIFNKFLNETEEIFVGGDISYGFGKMRIVNKEDNLANEKDLLDWGLTNKGNMNITVKNSSRNFIQISNSSKLKKGKLEFIVQYDFSDSIPSIEQAEYCFVPGSKIDIRGKDKKTYYLQKGVFIN